jgi:methionyl-tRNA formyltransferase
LSGLRLALLTIDSPLSAAAVLRLIASRPAEIALLGLSRPAGPAATWRALRRSGPRILPFLIANYGLPALRQGRLAAAAQAAGIPVRHIDDINAAGTAATIRAAAPDLLVTCHFDQILRPETIALAPRGGINVHPSLLPRHRGPVPTIWALAEEPPAWGVSVHRLAPRIDAGGILAQAAVELPSGISASAAARLLHLAALPLLDQAIAAIADGAPEPAPPALLPYCPFPASALLRDLARRGRRLVSPADVTSWIDP